MGGKRPKLSISPKMAAKLEAIPVWPDEVSLSFLGRKFGVVGVPADAPIGEDEGWVCYPTAKDKESYMRKVRELASSSKQSGKALRIKESEQEKRRLTDNREETDG